MGGGGAAAEGEGEEDGDAGDDHRYAVDVTEGIGEDFSHRRRELTAAAEGAGGRGAFRTDGGAAGGESTRSAGGATESARGHERAHAGGDARLEVRGVAGDGERGDDVLE